MSSRGISLCTQSLIIFDWICIFDRVKIKKDSRNKKSRRIAGRKVTVNLERDSHLLPPENIGSGSYALFLILF